MAKVWANSSFDIDAYNFGAMDWDEISGYGNDRTYHGVRYADWVSTENGAFIGGYDFLDDFKSDREDSDGVVTGLSGSFAYGSMNENVGLQGLHIPVMSIYYASRTSGDRDDRVLIRNAFSGDDTFDLSDQADLARGFAGDDVLKGHGGRDRLYAGTGHDTLAGGAGADKLHGGKDAAADVFDFNKVEDSRAGTSTHDTIYNFSSHHDHIDLRDIDAHAGGSNQAFGWGAHTAQAHDVWWTKVQGGVLLSADVTGDAKADFQVLLAGISTLDHGDVLL